MAGRQRPQSPPVLTRSLRRAPEATKIYAVLRVDLPCSPTSRCGSVSDHSASSTGLKRKKNKTLQFKGNAALRSEHGALAFFLGSRRKLPFHPANSRGSGENRTAVCGGPPHEGDKKRGLGRNTRMTSKPLAASGRVTTVAGAALIMHGGGGGGGAGSHTSHTLATSNK